jgi:hypothetical protein
VPPQKLYELAFAKQSAKGTPATAAQFRTRVTGGDVAPVRNVPDFAETGTTRLPYTSFVASMGVDGSPAMGVRDEVASHLLYAALGSKAVAGAGDPWTHTITPAAALPYYTFWRMLGNLVWEKFIDCKVSQLELVSEAEAALIMTATVVGLKAQALSSAVYATEATAAPLAGAGEAGTGLFVHHHGSGLLLVEGAAISRMERVAVNINNGVGRHMGDSIFAEDVIEGAQEITIGTRQRVAATEIALYNRLHYGTAAPTSGTDAVGTILELGGGGLDLMWRRQVTPERSIRFQTGSRVQVSAMGGMAPGTGNDPLRAEPTYRVLEPDSGVAFTGTLKNDLATI